MTDSSIEATPGPPSRGSLPSGPAPSEPPPSEPLLSVITVCLNRADTIAAALDSVDRERAALAPAEIEHLVIDGGSSDGTLAVVARFPMVKVVSEPDKGLYDAMNKGLRRATGRYVLLLNSDDALADGILAQALPMMSAGYDAICFGTDFIAAAPDAGPDGPRRVLEAITAPDAITLSPASVTLGSPLVNAKIFRRDFARRVGDFDLAFRLASDVDWLLRASLAGPRVAVLALVGHHYLEHAGSLTINAQDSNGRRAALECLAIADKALARSDLSASVRFLMRAWRGGKQLALARLDRRAGKGLACWRPVLAAPADIARFGCYLVDRKLRSPAQRLAAHDGWRGS